MSGTLTVARADEPAPLEPHPFLFRVLDCQRPLAAGSRHLLEGVTEVTLGRGDTVGAQRHGRALRLDVADAYVSTLHATLTRRNETWHLADSSKNGTFVNGARAERVALADGDLIEVGASFFVFRAALPAGPVQPDLDGAALADTPAGLATLLPALQQRFRQLERVARSPVSVVLRGETGTGKEVLARAIHELSRRRGELVAVNCGALPETLVESELFGYRKGAFSGAVEDRPGLVRAADGGTLLLDEVGDLPLASQAAFLRVLQERQVVPVGGVKPIPVDLRVVSASHLDLRALVAEKRFRPDLEARLCGVEVEVPPLRERREDLGLLIAAILTRAFPDSATPIVLDKGAARALLLHPFPKNIRELEQTLTGAVAMAGGLPISLEHLPAALRAPAPAPAPAAPPAAEKTQDRELRLELTAALEAHGGNVSAVARALGKPRKQIQRWLKRFALDAAAFRRV